MIAGDQGQFPVAVVRIGGGIGHVFASGAGLGLGTYRVVLALAREVVPELNQFSVAW